MKKIKVGVVMGGRSPEFKISILSGEEIIRHLAEDKYLVKPFILMENGFLSIKGFLKNHINFSYNESLFHLLGEDEVLSYFKEVEVVYNTIHGPSGEDGCIQGFLEIINLPYTGANIIGSAITINKLYSKLIAKEMGIEVPDYVVVNQEDMSKNEVYKRIDSIESDKVVIKPIMFGSSIGISIVKKEKEELQKALSKGFEVSDTLLIEEYISGIEITVPVIGSRYTTIFPLPPIEIVPIKSDFFDYYAKYDSSATYEIVPTRLENWVNVEAQKIALMLHKAFNLRGVSRSDMIYEPLSGRIFYLETNTTPGMTRNSLVPKSARFYGLSFKSLLDIIIQDALYK